jgi:DNA-binding MarR family transcriptional regulator
MLVASGFVTEHEAGGGRIGRDVVECASAVVEFSRNELTLGDPFALLLLLRTMGEIFVAKIDRIAASAHISRDTIDRYLAILEAAKLVVRERVSRSEYRYIVVVSGGTSAEIDRVQRVDSCPEPWSGKWARIAAQLLSRRGSNSEGRA